MATYISVYSQQQFHYSERVLDLEPSNLGLSSLEVIYCLWTSHSNSLALSLFLKHNFIYLCLAVLDLHFCAGFCLVVVSGSSLYLQCAGFSLQWLHVLWSTGSRTCGLQ